MIRPNSLSRAPRLNSPQLVSKLVMGAVSLLFACACGTPEPTASTESARSSAVAVDGESVLPIHSQQSTSEDEAMISVHVFNRSGELVGPVSVPPVVKSAEEWKAQLTPEQFDIVRKAGTERAFCGNLLDNKKEGVYSCVGCDLPLFASASKFDSGTGWPSFFQPIAQGNVAEKADHAYGMVRTEINCARCDGHLGHVFDDGPRPSGLRFCLNSESLDFTESEQLGSLADPAAESLSAAAPGTAPEATSGAESRAKIVFAGGCFWCVEAVFEELDGVVEAVSGYAGGTAENANYKAVCSGTTAHAEAVQIVFDPNKISYEDLLKVHFATHDPTTKDRQGNDVGPQYRSAIFYANPQEKELAQAFLQDLSEAELFPGPIVTTLEPLTEFFPAEDYHQNYVCLNPTQGYVRSVALPKVEKVREKFREKLKPVSPLGN